MNEIIKATRQHLLSQLEGGKAFDTFEDILSEVPESKRFVKPNGLEHSVWEILEHLRFSLEDIVDFTDNRQGGYREKEWPDDYWPTEPPTLEAWSKSLTGYREQHARLVRLVEMGDLFEVFEWGDGQTLFREGLLAADHEAYHLGEIVIVTRALHQAE